MPTPAIEIITILMEDHEKLQSLFARFSLIKNHGSVAERRALVEVACMELVIHLQIDEELLYPALRNALDRHDLLDEAEVEHKMARQLIDDIEILDADDRFYNAKFSVLGGYTMNHIGEEQKRIFPLIGQSDYDFDGLLEEIQERRFELRSGFGLPDHAYDDDGRYQMRIAPSLRH
jgi:hypothetical protein